MEKGEHLTDAPPALSSLSFFYFIVTLRAKHSGAVYCNRSCLWRTAGGRAGDVCYHDNSKLRESIFTKIDL